MQPTDTDWTLLGLVVVCAALIVAAMVSQSLVATADTYARTLGL